MVLDVAVIGAGLAGLACAQRLRQLGFQVVVVEKSRGLGGRLATRRLAGAHADHGARCLEDQGKLTALLIQMLCEQGILRPWTDTFYELQRSGRLSPSPLVHPRYAAIEGITAVAKFLGTGLEIWRSQQVRAIVPQSDRTWALMLEPPTVDSQPDRIARAIVVAIPAPQALALLSPLAEHGLPAAFLARLRSVRFDPCLTVIASYAAAQQADVANLSWQAVTCPEHPDLDWIAVDSTKQPQPQRPAVIIPAVIIQSTAAFAQSHLEDLDLQPAGQQLVHQAAQFLPSWLAQLETLQVHRWRYAFAVEPLTETYLSTLSPLPLGCSGDWCGGSTIDAALQSGLQCAAQIADCLTQKLESESLESKLLESKLLESKSLESELPETVWRPLLQQIALNL